MPALTDWLPIATDIATIAAAVTGIASAIYIARQLTLMKRSREVDTFLNIINQGNGDLVRTASNWLKHEMPAELSYEDALEASARERIAIVVHHFEMMGILVEQGYVSLDLVYDQMGPWIVGSWSKLQQIVGTHRMRKQAPDYAENFEILAAGYEKWSREHPAKLESRGRASSAALQSYYSSVPAHPPRMNAGDAHAPLKKEM